MTCSLDLNKAARTLVRLNVTPSQGIAQLPDDSILCAEHQHHRCLPVAALLGQAAARRHQGRALQHCGADPRVTLSSTAAAVQPPKDMPVTATREVSTRPVKRLSAPWAILARASMRKTMSSGLSASMRWRSLRAPPGLTTRPFTCV
eukprot:CAMPEP_0115098256 /NCGR_PEP_ID=MMETSP0227-20121206/31036_1 /TAXON_ID=89957 /ORGANISM="Polarella glacialis, Strain CCMP 1383" /LENGTH=146 /DNA_ID=CAMNT_0002492797 /DNA_START=297 /DNA_END=738 /DNA_ORIENTATION=-